MKSFVFILLALLLALPAHAATVSISLSSNAGPKFATSGGSLLVNGAVIRIGVFNVAGLNLSTLQSSNDYGLVESLFTPLGETLPNAGTVTQANNAAQNLIINSVIGSGNVLGQISNIESTYLATGSQLYAWVFNDANPALSSEWGIFTATTGWNFPNGLGSETLATFEVNSIIRGSTTGGVTTADQLRLSAVPEPGSALLVLAAACLMPRRRRPAL
jgi:hypothetical protein